MAAAIIPQLDADVRAAGYLLWARLFREPPTPKLLEAIVEQRMLSRIVGAQGAGHLLEDPRWPTQAEAIAVEYARLFAVPGEQAVHPYESAYCDTLSIDTSTACSAYFGDQRPIVGLAGFIGGSSASAVARAYAEAGFELNPAAHELPDHISIELEFMGRLLERGEVDQANTFFTDHLGRWVFRCLDEMRQKACSGFYRVVTESLRNFVHREQALLIRSV